MDRGKYRSVVKTAKRFVKRYADPAGREEMMLLAGEAELKRGRLFQGYEGFGRQLGESPGGPPRGAGDSLADRRSRARHGQGGAGADADRRRPVRAGRVGRIRRGLR